MSSFFTACKSRVSGKLEWFDWEECSKSCSRNGNCGVRVKYASSCTPEYAVCKEVPIQREDCGCNECPDDTPRILPVGTILSWVQKPNKGSSGLGAKYTDYPGWILCNGIEQCGDGEFKGQTCTDLQGRVLVGSTSSFAPLSTHKASLPNHHHPHSHTIPDHSHVVPPHSHKYDHHGDTVNCKTGTSMQNRCNKYGYSTTTEKSSSFSTNKYEGLKTHSLDTLGVKADNIQYDTVLGELYSKHMRVQFIFKCY